MSVRQNQQAEDPMLVVRGVVKGRTVLLPESIQLTDGAEVEVRVRAERRKYTPSEFSEKAFKDKLLEIGLLKEWRTPDQAITTSARLPAQVQGQLLSELVIAERR
jgi:hypothetical protein